MAPKNETWLIVVIVLIAGVLIALSFAKNKSADKAGVSSVVTSPAGAIKQDHDEADMAKIAATKPVSAVVEAPTPVAIKSAFAVQVFSFKDKARADAALKMVKAKGYPAYIMMSDLGERGVFFRVRVGSFVSEEEARKNLQAVTRDFNSGILVTE